MLGIALVAVGAWVGKVYGPKAERKFLRIVFFPLGALALSLVLGLSWWAIASGGGGSQPAATAAAAAETEPVETTDLPDATKRGCKRLAESAQKFSAFLNGRSVDTEKFDEEFHDFAVFSVLTSVPDAPDEIRDDLQVLDDAFSKYVDAVAGVDVAKLDQEPLEKQLQKKLSTEIDLQRVTQASQNISAWVPENCT